MAKSPAAAAALHPAASLAFAAASAPHAAIPIWLVETPAALTAITAITPHQRAWLIAQGFKPTARQMKLLPAADGTIAGVVVGAGRAPLPAGRPADPMARNELLAGGLVTQLPPGRYAFATAFDDPELAAVAWGLGSYRFRRYKSGDTDPLPQLMLPQGVDAHRVAAIIEGTAFGRDLINTPASDMGPAEIEDAVRTLAKTHGAKVTSIVGDD